MPSDKKPRRQPPSRKPSGGRDQAVVEARLKERVKELNCIYSLTGYFEAAGLHVENALRKIPALVKKSWQYPRETVVRLTVGKSRYQSRNFKKTRWCLAEDLTVNGKKEGALQVCYLHKMSDADEGPFLSEERKLIQELVKRIGSRIGNVRERRDLLAANQQLRAAEQQLQAANQQLRAGSMRLAAAGRQLSSLFNGIDDVIYVSDPETHELLYVNETFRKGWGSDPVGKKCYKVLQDRNEPCPFCTNDVIFKKKPGQTHVWEFQNELTKQWYRCADKAIDWPDGRKVRFEIAADITDRKNTERELLLKNIVFDASIAACSIADTAGNITHVNDAFLKLWGYEAKENAIGGSVASFFVNPEDAGPVMESLGNTGAWQGTFLAKRQDGGEFITRGFATTITDEKGELIGYQSANIDITAETEAADRIKREKGFVENLINSLPGVFYMIDSKGVFVRWNKRFEELTGLYGDDFGRRPPVDLFEGADRDLIAERIADSFEKGVSWAEAEILQEGGKKVPYYFTGNKVEYEDEPYVVGVGVDLTEIKKTQKELQTTLEALTRSNRELEQFAYVASHDLQEPLRMVASYVELLADRYQGKLDQDADDFIGFAVDGATRMQNLIRDLLAFSRVTTRGNEFVPTDVGKIVTNIKQSLEPMIIETGAVVEVGDMPTVAADPSQLERVFQNLVQNAIKFTPEDRKPQIRIAASRQNGQWHFSVADNGVGIDKEYFEKVFIIFHRLNRKSRYGGTGIGLSICKRIIERHGGRIWMESEPGNGTTFHFTIPAAD